MMIEISLFTLSVCKGKTFVSYDVEVLMRTGSVVTLTMIFTQLLYYFTFSLFFFFKIILLKKWKGSLPQFTDPPREVDERVNL